MRKNILIVDDDPDVRTSLKNIFEHEGHEVRSVENGVEYLELLEKGLTRILLIDLMMPQIDGCAIIEEIVRRFFQKNVNIIVITAIGTYRHHKMKGLEPYVYDYIAKPFDIKELIENIKKMKREATRVAFYLFLPHKVDVSDLGVCHDFSCWDNGRGLICAPLRSRTQ